ncbi:MAG: hypothetical protein ABIO40_11175, partial [Devosia sp.]
MAIVGLILAVLAGAIVWYWRLQLLRGMADEVATMFGRVKGRYRVDKFRRKVGGSTHAAIDDPAVAAAVFLFALVNESDGFALPAEAAVKAQIARVVPEARLAEIVSFAQWAARDVVDAKDCVRRFKPLWRDALDRSERDHLIRMAQAVVGLSDAPAPN